MSQDSHVGEMIVKLLFQLWLIDLSLFASFNISKPLSLSQAGFQWCPDTAKSPRVRQADVLTRA